MTEQTLQFQLVSPEAILVSEPVKMVVIPGVEGEMGIGPDHASLVSALKPGVVAVYHNGDAAPRRIFISGGFADVNGAGCTVLAESAIDVKDLKIDELERQITNRSEDLMLIQEPADKARVQAKLNLAKAKLQAVTGNIVF